MNKDTKEIITYFIPVWICSLTAIILFIVGFFMPPTGVIDGSVLSAAGEITAIIAVLEIPHCIEKGKSVSLKHNNTELHIDSNKKDHENDGEIQ